MDSNNWHTVTSIVDEALTLPENERMDFVKSACKDDEQMRDEVEQFLASISQSEGLWGNLMQSNRILIDDYMAAGETFCS